MFTREFLILLKVILTVDKQDKMLYSDKKPFGKKGAKCWKMQTVIRFKSSSNLYP